MTYPQWRTQIRLYRALRLLAKGHPVTDVACRCGWSSPSAFIEAFRRTLGYTPGQAVRSENSEFPNDERPLDCLPLSQRRSLRRGTVIARQLRR